MRARQIISSLAVAALWPCGMAFAQAPAKPCTGEEVSAVVDQTGARLRQLNSESQPRLRAKLRDVARKQAWGEADLESKGLALLVDEQVRMLDEQAGELLMKLDQLGDEGKAQGPTCQRLEEARITAAQLIEVTTARATHVSARLDAALKPTAAPEVETPATAMVAPPAPASAPVGSPPASAPHKAETKAEPKPPRAVPPPGNVASADPAATGGGRPKGPPAASWGAETIREASPNPTAIAELPRPIAPADLAFSPEDIRAAGRGVFGTISAELASVIDFSFSKYGRPTGYILGKEGGGAFLAGLRYGEGVLVTKLAGEHKIYWQGPSVGYDFGLAGSQVMFLVYSVTSPDELYSRFAGVDGSAYLVGGVGITFLKKGPIVLAPIRTGLGLRVGANIGYLKFTPEPSLNPF